MDLVSLIYRCLYDSLATIDISGGVLLAAIWFQTGYVALFRAMHGEDAGRAPTPAVRRAMPGPASPKLTPPEPAPRRSSSPWGSR
jgi:hypothetical protein